MTLDEFQRRWGETSPTVRYPNPSLDRRREVAHEAFAALANAVRMCESAGLRLENVASAGLDGAMMEECDVPVVR